MNRKDAPQFSIAAIDLDGTLLSPDLSISAANIEAVRRLQDAGAEVVLASGRHFESMRPFADSLPGVRWIVSVQGGEVANVDRTLVLERNHLESDATRQVLELGRELDFSAVVYTAEGIFTEAEHDAGVEFYAWLAGRKPARAGWGELLALRAFKVLWVGEPARITALRGLREIDALLVQKVQTHARMFEFMPDGVSKGTGLEILAQHLGSRADDAVVFGDGENDIPMFEWAGTSVAMSHGWPAARERATHVAPEGPPETAFARAVELVLATAPDAP